MSNTSMKKRSTSQPPGRRQSEISDTSRRSLKAAERSGVSSSFITPRATSTSPSKSINRSSISSYSVSSVGTGRRGYAAQLLDTNRLDTVALSKRLEKQILDNERVIAVARIRSRSSSPSPQRGVQVGSDPTLIAPKSLASADIDQLSLMIRARVNPSTRISHLAQSAANESKQHMQQILKQVPVDQVEAATVPVARHSATTISPPRRAFPRSVIPSPPSAESKSVKIFNEAIPDHTSTTIQHLRSRRFRPVQSSLDTSLPSDQSFDRILSTRSTSSRSPPLQQSSIASKSQTNFGPDSYAAIHLSKSQSAPIIVYPAGPTAGEFHIPQEWDALYERTPALDPAEPLSVSSTVTLTGDGYRLNFAMEEPHTTRERQLLRALDDLYLLLTNRGTRTMNDSTLQSSPISPSKISSGPKNSTPLQTFKNALHDEAVVNLVHQFPSPIAKVSPLTSSARSSSTPRTVKKAAPTSVQVSVTVKKGKMTPKPGIVQTRPTPKRSQSQPKTMETPRRASSVTPAPVSLRSKKRPLSVQRKRSAQDLEFDALIAEATEKMDKVMKSEQERQQHQHPARLRRIQSVSTLPSTVSPRLAGSAPRPPSPGMVRGSRNFPLTALMPETPPAHLRISLSKLRTDLSEVSEMNITEMGNITRRETEERTFVLSPDN